MRRKFRKNLKGISTVIATIIIVAISIVMAIAVAYWALGIGSSFTRFEKIEFTSAYVDSNATAWIVQIEMKNTGTADASVGTIFLNGRPWDSASYTGVSQSGLANQSIAIGKTVIGSITLLKTSGNWTSSMNVEVMIQTSAGKQYPKLVTLP
jgi:FlaG/FlaF family flagellin (archaellin)